MKSVNPFDCGARILGRSNLVNHMDSADDQDVVLELDLSLRLACQSFHCDFAR